MTALTQVNNGLGQLRWTASTVHGGKTHGVVLVAPLCVLVRAHLPVNDIQRVDLNKS